MIQGDMLRQLEDEDYGGRGQELRNAYREVFESPAGKEVFLHMAKRFGLYDDTFDVDPHANAYNAGMRAVVIHIGKMLDYDEVRLQMIQREANQ